MTQHKQAVSKYDKLIGYHVIEPDIQLVEEKINEGYSFVAFSLDTIFLGSKLTRAISEMKNLTK